MCSICNSKEKTKFIDLYVFGSEGLYLCHECEMKLVEFVRGTKSQYLKKRMEEYKLNKRYNKTLILL
jgi:hypothetical protein